MAYTLPRRAADFASDLEKIVRKMDEESLTILDPEVYEMLDGIRLDKLAALLREVSRMDADAISPKASPR